MLAFYPIQQGKEKARVPAVSSVEEYIQNLPHVLARHEQSGSSGQANGNHPFVPGAEVNPSNGRTLELNTNILFESDSPGSVLGLWKDRLVFLRKLCNDSNYVKLLAWLERVQVCAISTTRRYPYADMHIPDTFHALYSRWMAYSTILGNLELPQPVATRNRV